MPEATETIRHVESIAESLNANVSFKVPAEVVYERLRRLGLSPSDVDAILRRGGCTKVVEENGNFIVCPLVKVSEKGAEIELQNFVLMQACLEYIAKLLKVK